MQGWRPAMQKFSLEIAFSRGASSHSRRKARSRVERPRILAGNRALAWSVLTFSPEIPLSRGASSHSRRKSRSRVERPHILAGNRVLAWSVLAFSPEIVLSRGASSHFVGERRHG